MEAKVKITKTFKGHQVEFTIGVQTFSLYELLAAREMTSYQRAKWYKGCLETAFKNLESSQPSLDIGAKEITDDEISNKADEYFPDMTEESSNARMGFKIGLRVGWKMRNCHSTPQNAGVVTEEETEEEAKQMLKKKIGCYAMNLAESEVTDLMVSLVKSILSRLNQSGSPKEQRNTESEHYTWKECKQICNYLEKECPINDTVAGSTCPMCVHNPDQTKVVYKTKKS